MPETNFFWDPLSDNILQERDETGLLTSEYTNEPGLYGNLISQNRGGVESQYHFDPQGSTLALTSDEQNITDTYSYSAFGNLSEHTGDAFNPFRFLGRRGYYSVGNYVVIRRRTYIPTLGLWLSVDPIGHRSLLARLNVSVYCYGNNSPLSAVDPSGQDPVADPIIPGEWPPFPIIEPPDVSPPRPPLITVPKSDLCMTIPCASYDWSPALCNRADAFGPIPCKCSDTQTGKKADTDSCAGWLAAAQRLVTIPIGVNVVLVKAVCAEKCGGTDYGLTCWRRQTEGPNAGKLEVGICIPVNKWSKCVVETLIWHELKHLVDIIDRIKNGGDAPGPDDRVDFERRAYAVQCGVKADQDCVPAAEKAAFVARCVADLIELSTAPGNVRIIGTGCDNFW